MGVSGVGKSTVIRALLQMDGRYRYISPLVTRPLRATETDKFSVTPEVLNGMRERDELLCINDLYGVHYGTPRRPIEVALESSEFPVLDWPVSKLGVMVAAFGDRLFRVYLAPPSLEELEARLRADHRDVSGERLARGKEELDMYRQGRMADKSDLVLVIGHGEQGAAALAIHEAFLRSCGGP